MQMLSLLLLLLLPQRRCPPTALPAAISAVVASAVASAAAANIYVGQAGSSRIAQHTSTELSDCSSKQCQHAKPGHQEPDNARSSYMREPKAAKSDCNFHAPTEDIGGKVEFINSHDGSAPSWARDRPSLMLAPESTHSTQSLVLN